MLVDLSYEMLPFQKECDLAIKRGKRFVMWSGGIRSGKTFGAVRAFWNEIIKQSNETFWIVVPTFKQMKGSQKIFEEGTTFGKEFIWTVPPEFYKWFIVHHNRMEKVYKTRNNNLIEYKTGERVDDLRSVPIAGALIDEGAQLCDEGFQILRGRVVDKKGFLYVSTTPRGTANWTYTKFYQEVLKRNKNYFVAFGNTTDNKFLPEDERKEIAKEYEGKWAEQELYGKFIDFAGLIYDSFNTSKGFYRELPAYNFQWFAGIDFGWEAPSGYLLVARSMENFGIAPHINMQTVYWVESEICINHTMPEELAGMIKDKEEYYKFQRIFRYADNKDPKCRVGLAKSCFHITTLPAKQDKGDVLRGIRKTYDLFRQNRIRINEINCPNLINELQNYRFKEGTDVPIDHFDHLLDPLRYIIYGQEGYKIEGEKRIVIQRKPLSMFSRI